MSLQSIRRTLGVILAGLSLSVWGLGEDFRVLSYSPTGSITYGWDYSDGTMANTYTLRRNGVIVGRSTGIVKPYDGPIYFGETYRATLQVDDGPESAVLPVSLPAAPVAPAGGELLWVVLSFADYEHPIWPDLFQHVQSLAEWVTRVSGLRTPLTSTVVMFQASGPLSSYCAGTFVDMPKLKAEITETLNLRARPNLHRVMLDSEGLPGCVPDYLPIPPNYGTPMWEGGPWAPQVYRKVALHELLHTYGLWHSGHIPAIPANVDDLSGYLLTATGTEVMGSGGWETGLSILHLLQLGWRDPDQLQRVTASTTLTLTNTNLPSGTQGAYIQLSAAGAGYVIDYRDAVRVVLRPNTYAGNNFADFGILQIGTAFGYSAGRILTDTQRGITVDLLSANGTTASVRITMPGVQPTPTPTTTTVRIVSPETGSSVGAKSRIALAAVTEPAGKPITWTASGGSISGSIWTAPGARNKTYTLTATSGGAKASVTVRTR